MRDVANKLRVRDLCVSRDGVHVLSNVSFDIRSSAVTVLLGGPSCGKTTLLRAMSRLDRDCSLSVVGSIELRGEDVYGPDVDVADLHRRLGMVFSVPAIFPGSVEKNVGYGLRVAGIDEDRIEAGIERSLRAVGLWETVRDRLASSAADLTPIEQQRLCIARALTLDPEVLLLDDPARDLSGGDRRALDELVAFLRTQCTVVLATRDAVEAERVGDDVALFCNGTFIVRN